MIANHANLICWIIEANASQAETKVNIGNSAHQPRRDAKQKNAPPEATLLVELEHDEAGNGQDVAKDPSKRDESDVCLEIKYRFDKKDCIELLKCQEGREDPDATKSEKKSEVGTADKLNGGLLTDRDCQVMKEEEGEQATASLDIGSSAEDQTAKSSSSSGELSV